MKGRRIFKRFLQFAFLGALCILCLQLEKALIAQYTGLETRDVGNSIVASLDDLPSFTAAVNCKKLFSGDVAELASANIHQDKYKKVPVSALTYINETKNCNDFRRKRNYIMKKMSQDEEEFPIAFSILMFKHVEQVERLLRAIYRPQNYYCIHVDANADKLSKMAMFSIAKCFDNVFIPSKSVKVQWGKFSVLEADLICMRELLKYKKWRYFINLTGQEFPLRTNAELVRILKIYNGANNMEATIKRQNKERFKGRVKAPHSVVPVKGSVHITASRAFVEYAIHNRVATDYLSWLRDKEVPDESFFSTLNHNPHLRVPGSYKGTPETDPQTYPFVTRFKNWGVYPFNYKCTGQRVRMVCIFGIGDLPLLQSRPELFANKFYLDWQPLALDCMEELYFNRTRDDFTGKRRFDGTYYASLPFVKNHI